MRLCKSDIFYSKTQSQSTTPSKTVSATSKVTKKASKITAKKATFKKSKKVKKYSIILKDGKNPIKKLRSIWKLRVKPIRPLLRLQSYPGKALSLPRFPLKAILCIMLLVNLSKLKSNR